MHASCGILAFGLPGTQEWLVILVVGLLIFGRRLPEVGRTLGKAVTEFRRGLNNIKEELRNDEELRDIRSVVHDFKKVVDAPRVLADPRRIFENLTHEAQATPGPEAHVVPAPPEHSLLEQEATKPHEPEPPA